jgi:hypothetical protein
MNYENSPYLTGICYLIEFEGVAAADYVRDTESLFNYFHSWVGYSH